MISFCPDSSHKFIGAWRKILSSIFSHLNCQWWINYGGRYYNFYGWWVPALVSWMTYSFRTWWINIAVSATQFRLAAQFITGRHIFVGLFIVACSFVIGRQWHESNDLASEIICKMNFEQRRMGAAFFFIFLFFYFLINGFIIQSPILSE